MYLEPLSIRTRKGPTQIDATLAGASVRNASNVFAAVKIMKTMTVEIWNVARTIRDKRTRAEVDVLPALMYCLDSSGLRTSSLRVCSRVSLSRRPFKQPVSENRQVDLDLGLRVTLSSVPRARTKARMSIYACWLCKVFHSCRCCSL